jgi:hypothetical protein
MGSGMSGAGRSGDEGMQIVAHIVARAEEWALEEGLKGPFTSQLSANENVFMVNVQGLDGSASCTFQRDGRRSMYERVK